ncbi:hypothetical protein ACO0RG_001809 [Hanseniaspora osmophila]|uniref:Succinate dehydrogenase [ubiquinone] cytochrome b subunit, mitochondrial n=1 Tax=Hanseniaspora osmophila TaxID=56408 RepID=A0A1E5RHV4_9ASCO|nr:Succinate dehydrogenase [ubiquinone] cytochrome b subunit, mitochondrial [Hanseniaspora osmophila]
MFRVVGLQSSSMLLAKSSLASTLSKARAATSRTASSAAFTRAMRTAAPGKRFMSTEATSIKEANKILVNQRAHRPVSPHLTIYQPQITWYLSSVHRISGVFLGMAFFGATIAFGVSGLLGLGLTTDKLSEFYHTHVPKWMDYTVKGGFAYLFAFHFGNGIRHLIWDAGKGFTIKGIYAGGYAVMALTVVAGTNFFLKSF